MNENRFDGKSNTYAKYRPSYPKESLNSIFNELGIDSTSVIADIGSGTGIFTKLLLEKGNSVYAVEPNNDMRAKAESDLCKYENFYSVNGSAEATTLADDSVDCITVAQAFHWFNVEEFKAECKRILKPSGKVVLVWNSRDEEHIINKENEKINKTFCESFTGFSGGISGPMKSKNISAFFSGDYQMKSFENFIRFDKDGFIGRNLSSSYAPKENDENYEEYVKALEDMFDKYSENGAMNCPHYTKYYYGEI